MSDPLFLSGAIPGLLRRCAPVVHRYGNAGLVLSVDDGTWGDRKRAPTAVVCPDTSNSGGRYEVAPLPLADVALDLRDPAGRDIAARWVAASVGEKVGITAPIWWRVPDAPIWLLMVTPRTNVVRVAAKLPHSTSIPSAYTIVPALAAIPLDDPNADALALAAVVRHLAGVTP